MPICDQWNIVVFGLSTDHTDDQYLNMGKAASKRLNELDRFELVFAFINSPGLKT